MIRVNLLGREGRKKKAGASLNAGQRLTVACSLVLVAAAGGIGWWYYSLDQASARVDADLADAQQQLAQLQPVLIQLQRSQQRQQALQQRVALIEQLRVGQSLPVQLLDHVSKSLPEMLWLTQMNQVNSEVTIEGRSTTLISLSDFVGNLGTSALLQKPIEIVTSQVESAPATATSGQASGPAVDLIRFVVKAQLAPLTRQNSAAAPGQPGGSPAPPAPGGAR